MGLIEIIFFHSLFSRRPGKPTSAAAMPWIRRMFLERGLEAVGFDVARQRTRSATRVRRFRASFGTGPGACSAIYQDLQTTQIANARIDKPDSFYFFGGNELACNIQERRRDGRILPVP